MISGLRMDRLARNVAEHRSETALPREGRMMDNVKPGLRNGKSWRDRWPKRRGLAQN